MTTLATSASSSTIALPGPSPAKKSNPFARPTVSHSPSSFKRTSLLPTFDSPINSINPISPFDPLATPADKGINGHATGAASVPKAKTGWRLLWRGGVEIGKDGWRLEGITFFAQLSFPPPTPSIAERANPFDVPIQPTPGMTASPFHSLPDGDTDLCLSLESMRGRKYLQVRGVVDLPEDEVLEGGDEAGVQMSIAPSAPLAAAYFTSMLCRHPKLSVMGRTLSAITIGLGDDDSPSSRVLVYGQLATETDGRTLKLCVGRRRPKPPPPAEKKVRPGEPLPRAPLFFPVKAPKNPPPPFPRNRTARSLSRAPSVSSIYAHPLPPSTSSVNGTDNRPLPPGAVGSGRTPGRRGEKRPRPDGQEKEDERRRKAGKIVPLARPAPTTSDSGGRPDIVKKERLDENGEEDIFGKRGSSIGPPASIKSDGPLGEDLTDPKGKRARVPQQILDNKAVIRKQTLVLMEEKGYPRSHESFKDVFGMTTKGTYFALRNRLEDGPLTKIDVQRIIQIHLEVYLPDPDPMLDMQILSQVKEEDEDEGEERGLFDIAGEIMEDARPVALPSEGLTSDGALSDGMLSEEPLSEDPISDGPRSDKTDTA